MSNNVLYTVYMTVRKPFSKNGVTEERDILTIYYDTTWPQLCAMQKKEPTARVTVEAQSRKTGRIFETHVLEDVSYSDAAIENSKRLREQGATRIAGVPGSATKKAEKTEFRSKPTPGVSVNPGMSSYADAINAAMRGA